MDVKFLNEIIRQTFKDEINENENELSIKENNTLSIDEFEDFKEVEIVDVN